MEQKDMMLIESNIQREMDTFQKNFCKAAANIPSVSERESFRLERINYKILENLVSIRHLLNTILIQKF